MGRSSTLATMLRLLPCVLGASIWVLPSLVGGTPQPWDEWPAFPIVLLILSLLCVGGLSALYPDQAKTWWTSAALGFILGTIGWIAVYVLFFESIGQHDRIPFATMLVMAWSVYALAFWISSHVGRFIGSRRSSVAV